VSPPLPSETRPGEKPLPLPEFRKPAPELLELPPVKPPEAGHVPLGVRVTVRKFRITGNTAISDAELAKVAAPSRTASSAAPSWRSCAASSRCSTSTAATSIPAR